MSYRVTDRVRMDQFFADLANSNLSQSDKDLLMNLGKVNYNYRDLSQEGVEYVFNQFYETENDCVLIEIVKSNVIYKSPYKFIDEHYDWIIETYDCIDLVKFLNVCDDKERKDYFLETVLHSRINSPINFYPCVLVHAEDSRELEEYIKVNHSELDDQINEEYDRTDINRYSGLLFLRRMIEVVGDKKVNIIHYHDFIDEDDCRNSRSRLLDGTRLDIGTSRIQFGAIYKNVEIVYEDGTKDILT